MNSSYRLIDLGTGFPRSVNDRGEAVGGAPVYDPGGDSRLCRIDATVWARDAEPIRLPGLGGLHAWACDINNSGQVVGGARSESGLLQAVLWEDGQVVDLLAGEAFESEAAAINEKGEVTGWIRDVDGRGRGFLWRDGQRHDLGLLPGFTGCYPFDLNDEGQVIGNLGTDGGLVRAFLWQAGEMTELAPLLDHPNSYANGINNRGLVVGCSRSGETAGYQCFGCQWHDTEVQDLGTLGRAYTSANDVNDRGEVVGESQLTTGGLRGFRYWEGKLVDVGTLGGRSSQAQGINSQGEIVGWSGAANRATHLTHVYLATPLY